MKSPAVLRWAVLGVVLAGGGCAQAPVVYDDAKPPTDVIELRMAYPEAFDGVVRALEGEGYEIEVADERVGLIRTAPKPQEGAQGVAYKTTVVVRMGGTDRESWLAVDLVAIPTFPDQERKVKERLKGLAR